MYFFFIVSNQILKALVFAYFLWEMAVKMVAQGIYGHRGSYLADKWNKIDMIVTCGQLVSHYFSCQLRILFITDEKLYATNQYSSAQVKVNERTQK